MSEQRLKLFISHSGSRSKTAAGMLRDWLPTVLQGVKPWMSDQDIGSGARWAQEVAGELENSDFGIVCLTPENLDSRWINFEAGALSKLPASKVVPLLFAGLSSEQVSGPLGQFQMQVATDQDQMFKLVESVNRASPEPVDMSLIKTPFHDYHWKQFEAKVQQLPEQVPSGDPVSHRSASDILNEILEIVRAGSYIPNWLPPVAPPSQYGRWQKAPDEELLLPASSVDAAIGYPGSPRSAWVRWDGRKFVSLTTNDWAFEDTVENLRRLVPALLADGYSLKEARAYGGCAHVVLESAMTEEHVKKYRKWPYLRIDAEGSRIDTLSETAEE